MRRAGIGLADGVVGWHGDPHRMRILDAHLHAWQRRRAGDGGGRPFEINAEGAHAGAAGAFFVGDHPAVQRIPGDAKHLAREAQTFEHVGWQGGGQVFGGGRIAAELLVSVGQHDGLCTSHQMQFGARQRVAGATHIADGERARSRRWRNETGLAVEVAQVRQRLIDDHAAGERVAIGEPPSGRRQLQAAVGELGQHQVHHLIAVGTAFLARSQNGVGGVGVGHADLAVDMARVAIDAQVDGQWELADIAAVGDAVGGQPAIALVRGNHLKMNVDGGRIDQRAELGRVVVRAYALFRRRNGGHGRRATAVQVDRPLRQGQAEAEGGVAAGVGGLAFQIVRAADDFVVDGRCVELRGHLDRG